MYRQKVMYFASLAAKRLKNEGMTCPNCGSGTFARVDQKFAVASLRRCQACRLMYRAPTDSGTENQTFYQDDYSEGFTTSLPDDATLASMKSTKFAGTEKDFAPKIAMLKALGLGAGARLIDYGCSWGYGSWQFAQAGFDVTAFEISRPRGSFARDKLGVNVYHTIPKTDDVIEGTFGTFDVFFSSHVLEHVPSPSEFLKLARKIVRPGGWLFILTPNGSEAFRRAAPKNWHSMWGKVHPQMIDPEFYEAELGESVFLGATPVSLEAIADFASAPRKLRTDMALSSELLCIARL